MVLTGSWDQDLALWNVKDMIKWANSFMILSKSKGFNFGFVHSSSCSLDRVASFKPYPFINDNLTFKHTSVIVVENKVILHVDDKSSSTWFCHEKLIEFISIVGRNWKIIISFKFLMFEFYIIDIPTSFVM